MDNDITSGSDPDAARVLKGAGRVKQDRTKRIAPANIADRLALFFSAGRYVDGLWIGTWEDKPEPILRRIEEALALIKRYDRVRYDRLLRDLRRVWVLVLPTGLGCYDRRIDACEIDSRYFLAETTTLELIASTIVHEATHARLWHLGLSYDEALRPRIEAICMRREIAFAAKLPDGDEIRDKAERTLTLCASQDYWTNVAFRERHHEGSVKALRYLGTPEWVIRVILIVHFGIGYLRRGLRHLRHALGASRS